MATKADLLKTLALVEAGIIENTKALKPPTLRQRLASFLSQRTEAFKMTPEQKKRQKELWKAEVAKLPAIRAARIEKAKKLRGRKENILKALSVWLDGGDVIGSYERANNTEEAQ